MAHPVGKSPMESIKSFRARHWYDRAFVDCGSRIAAEYISCNEVTRGGIVSAGSGEDDSGAIKVDLTELEPCVLNGRVMVKINAQTDRDLLVSGETHIGHAIYSDGSAAAAASVATDETAYATLIVCNSDGSGGATETDNGQPKYLLILAGTGTGSYDDDHLTSIEIQDAIEASTGVHAGVTGWAHVAQIVWADASGTVTVVPTMNRNNVTSEA